MPIRKQDFYEGAALYQLARTGSINNIRWNWPFFVFNDSISVLLKYSTRGRSPWYFTFNPDEQDALYQCAKQRKTSIGLICGSDGVVGISYGTYFKIAGLRPTALNVTCYRDHGEHYEVRGPEGVLPKKVSPSSWQKILMDESNEAHRRSFESVTDANIQC